MTIKILIERQFKEAPRASDVRILNDFRIRAMGQVGYISGETLVDLEDEKKILVLSVWSRLEDWETWQKSKERKGLEEKLSQGLEKKPNIKVLLPGADSLRKILTQVIHDSENVV